MDVPHPIASRPIGAILMDRGLLTPEGAESILKLQREAKLPFGDAAIQLGLLTEGDIQFALSQQFDYAYLPQTGDKPVSDELVAAYRPFSHEVEDLRAIRSQLMLRWFSKDKARKAIVVVGSGRGEGRSFLAANLAVVFSQLGERTLLVDADMRNPRQHQLFKLDNRIGLSSLLGGRANGNTIVPVEAFSSLAVLPAGPTPPNPQELLGRPAFGHFLEMVGGLYDVVLIDTPAAAGCADGAMIATRVGAALVVARRNETRVAAFADMARSLTAAGVAVVGSVLNAPPPAGALN
ncbi:MAG TPA: chain length determinant protein tyrosine kinase EpsG [Rhodocyclaceae bacterium]|nr:chain length determinant protein tyrosine kinase EpsG [Rhodocyclaceae bacterium]